MNLYHIGDLVQALSEFNSILAALRKDEGRSLVLHLPEQAYSVLAAAIYKSIGSPVLFLSAHPETAKRRYEQIKMWMPQAEVVQYFPEVDLLAMSDSGDPLVISERLKTLSSLSDCTAIHKGIAAPLIVTSSLSLMSKSMPMKSLASSCTLIKRGEGFKIVPVGAPVH